MRLDRRARHPARFRSIRRCAGLTLSLILLAAAPAAAQLPTPQRPGPYVIDLRGATVGFPSDPAFFPVAPSGTVVPARGLGFDVGGHVYLFNLGPARLGVGASLLRARRKTSPPEPVTTPGTTTPTPPRRIPDVEATVTMIAPQLSFNFGTADGWSYLSAGLGTTSIITRTSVVEPSETLESAGISTLNFGGGARWFRSRRLAVGFDVRFHMVADNPREPPLRSTAGGMLISASGGISLR